MEICSRFTGMERKNGAFLLHTDNADVKVCFVTDEIVRVRANANLSGRAPPSCLRKTALLLKSPTGAFIASQTQIFTRRVPVSARGAPLRPSAGWLQGSFYP